MNRDLPRRPQLSKDDSLWERLAEILRRILVPGAAPRLVPVPVRVPASGPVVRRRA